MVMKGAPEVIMSRCATVFFNGQTEPLTDDWKKNFDETCDQLCSRPERVIGFCDAELPVSQFPVGYVFDTDDDIVEFSLTGLRFLGLVSMIDPPRSAVPNAIDKCQIAGIKVVMITGWSDRIRPAPQFIVF